MWPVEYSANTRVLRSLTDPKEHIIMSATAEQTNATTNDAKADKPKRTRAATIEHSAAIAAYAKAKDIDTTRAGKQFRAVLRANADKYVKAGGKQHAKNAPWPAHPRKALRELFPTVPAFKG